MVEVIARENSLDAGEIWQSLVRQFPGLNDPSHCANCDASMMEYTHEFDCVNAAMLVAMGKEVKRRIEKGLEFTVANQIHVQSLSGATYAMKSRTTQMSNLGLIAKLLNDEKRHIGGTWVITRRGWAALRGERVPKMVKV